MNSWEGLSAFWQEGTFGPFCTLCTGWFEDDLSYILKAALVLRLLLYHNVSALSCAWQARACSGAASSQQPHTRCCEPSHRQPVGVGLYAEVSVPFSPVHFETDNRRTKATLLSLNAQTRLHTQGESCTWHRFSNKDTKKVTACFTWWFYCFRLHSCCKVEVYNTPWKLACL